MLVGGALLENIPICRSFNMPVLSGGLFVRNGRAVSVSCDCAYGDTRIDRVTLAHADPHADPYTHAQPHR